MTETMQRGMPLIVDRAAWRAEIDALRVHEKTLSHQSDAVAAARRRLPMVEMDPTVTLIGPNGPVTLLEAFEGRRQLMAYYFMWSTGQPASAQCRGCTWCTSHIRELTYLHSRDITFAVFCRGPYDESVRYRDFMGWEMPWYSAQPSLPVLLEGREDSSINLACYLRDGDRVFETYWTTNRGVEVMDNSYALMDLTVFGRRETFEDSPTGWPHDCEGHSVLNGRPIAQWARLDAGYSDDLGNGIS